MPMKRVLAMSDLHSGHLSGLTHPDFDVRHSKNRKLYAPIEKARREIWNWYAAEMQAIQPVDICIVNGDCLEGKGPKSGGTELIASDRTEQVEMAEAAIKVANAKVYLMSFGTGYHVGSDDDWENSVARLLKAKKIGGHDYVKINGTIVDYKHFVGNSSVPHGRATPLARERLWSILWAGAFPLAKIILRSHVHYHTFVGDANFIAMTLPALQGLGTKFGTRKCSGIVDVGFVVFDIEENGSFSWKAHILEPSKQFPMVF